MSKWFDPHTVSGWWLSRLVRKPLLSVTLLLSAAYVKRHGPLAPTPRHIMAQSAVLETDHSGAQAKNEMELA